MKIQPKKWVKSYSDHFVFYSLFFLLIVATTIFVSFYYGSLAKFHLDKTFSSVIIPFSTPASYREYYSNPPLRVGTIGATTYHRPFCPHAKRSLELYGLAKRVNYWTVSEVSTSNRTPDKFCDAANFGDSRTPEDFSSGSDYSCAWETLSSWNEMQDMEDWSLCKINNYMAVFVDSPGNCINNGEIKLNTTVKVVLMNSIVHKKGDANLDGDCDDEDYKFFQECYLNNSSVNCLRAFDFDDDNDIDTDDFDMFQESLYSGNSYWGCNFNQKADGFVIDMGQKQPLRVGIEGSQYYHKISCPKIWESWNNFGVERRVEWYSWEQINSSGRIPSGGAGVGEDCIAERSLNDTPIDDCDSKKERCP